MHFISVVGARPQFIKSSMLSLEFENRKISESLVHTGQHYDRAMSDIFFEELGLKAPKYNLGIGGKSHAESTGLMLIELEKIFVKEKPHCVVVFGDTNTTLAAALAAAKLKIPVAHIEGGMRAFDREQAEEINRVVTDHLAYLHFVTGDAPKNWLLREGIETHVYRVGDIMLDSLLYFKKNLNNRKSRLGAMELENMDYALATIHRAENTDDAPRLRSIVQSLEKISEKLPVIFPIHPRTKKMMQTLNLELSKRIHCIEPLGYLEMLDFESHAKLILTDSGGVQKEAFYFSIPCVTFKERTEWIETVDLGWNKLVGVEPLKILEAVELFLKKTPSQAPTSIYGDGQAAKKIVDLLTEVFGRS